MQAVFIWGGVCGPLPDPPHVPVFCPILRPCVGVNMESQMRKDLFTHLQTLDFRFFDNTKVGHLMSRIVNDLRDISELAHHGPEDLFICQLNAGRFVCVPADDQRTADFDHLCVYTHYRLVCLHAANCHGGSGLL